MLGSYIDLGNPVSDDPINDGLVSLWLPLENNSGGGTLFDLKGGINGTLGASTARPTWAAGPNGFGALSFDGGDKVQTAAESSLALTSSISAFAAVNTSVTGERHFIGCYNAGSPFNGWALATGTSGAGPVSFWSSGTFAWRGSTGDFRDGKWHLVGAVASVASSTVTFYIDGKPSGSGSYTAPAAFTGAKGIGCRSDGASPMSGLLGAAWVYDRTLSTPEVSALHADWLAGYQRILRRWRRSVAVSAGGGGGATPVPVFAHHYRQMARVCS